MAVKKDKPQGTAGASKTASRMQAANREDAGNGGGGARDRSAAFDQTKPQGKVDDGKYEAVIAEILLQDPDQKGQSARMKYVIASEGEYQGADITQFYKLFEANDDVGKGAAFLKKDLAVLGYEDVKFTDLEDLFDDITEEKPGVVIQVKNNGQFVNAYLQGLAEGSDIIAEFKDTHKF